ncbi:MAG: CPBP family intramembrane glutamic endopeptidase [Bacteroidales bacterium]
MRGFIRGVGSYLPTLRESWILVLLLTVGGTLLTAVVLFPLSFLPPSALAKFELLLYPLIFIPPLLYINRTIEKREEKRESPIPLKSANWGSAGVVPHFLLLLLLLFSVNYLIEPLTSWMGTPKFLEKLLDTIVKNKISSFISLVLFAPILEEIFCRAIILRGLLYHTTPTKAIIWSSIIFGVIHLNPWQAIPAIIIGLVMGWVYWKSNSLWSTIFIHFVNNLFSYLITVLYPSLPADAGFKTLLPLNLYWYLYIVAAAVAILSLIFINRQYEHSIPAKI